MSYPADLYAAVHDGTPGDLAFYREQCRDADSILELGCGHGRVLSALVEQAEDLVGLDLDEPLLARARETLGNAVEWVHGDMRSFDLGRTFDRILIPHTGVYCLLTPDDVHRCFERVAAHLAPGGRFIFDGYDADAFHQDSAPEDLEEEALVPVKRIDVRGESWQVLERSHWDRDHQRIDAHYLHVSPGGQVIEATIFQRYLRTDQLPDLLAPAGLQLLDLGVRFGEDHGGPVWAATASRTE